MKTLEQINSFIERQKMSFIGFLDSEGFPNIQATQMPRKVDGKCYYFAAHLSSIQVKKLQDNNKACVYFNNKGLFKSEGIMLTGTMEILTDPSSKKSMWRTGDSMLYKKGVSDPDYCVLKFTASKSDYYCDTQTESTEL